MKLFFLKKIDMVITYKPLIERYNQQQRIKLFGHSFFFFSLVDYFDIPFLEYGKQALQYLSITTSFT